MEIVEAADQKATSEWLNELARALASQGAAANEIGLRQTARWARAAGVSPVLVDLLVDPTAPQVARMRAFGKASAALAASAAAPAESLLRVA